MKSFRLDLIAGMTVSVLMVPQAMAYALLAGLPPIYGLYAALIPSLIYPIFGSSRVLSVGPVALVSILIVSEIGTLAEPNTLEFVQYTILTSLIAGLMQLTLSAIRVGFLINFLSRPVLTGFTSAAVIIISISQVTHILGIQASASAQLFPLIENIWQNIVQTNIYTFLVGIIAVSLLFIVKRFSRSFPAALLVIAIGVIIVYLFDLDDLGVGIVGHVPSGLPSFQIPLLDWQVIVKLLPVSLAVCLISFIESLAIAKAIAGKNQNERISADQELFALGLAKVIGSFFQAYPNTGSFSRTAINEESGAKTGVSSIVTAAMVGLTLLFLTDLIYFVPKTILAAIVITSVIGLIKIGEIRYIYRVDRKDFAVLTLTFVLTLLLGVQLGVFSGIILAILIILYKSSQPHYAVLGRLPETDIYRNVKRYDSAITSSRVLIFRLDASLYFGNAVFFYEKLNSEIHKKMPDLKAVVFDCSAILDIDTTGMQQLSLIVDELKDLNIIFIVSGVLGPVRDIMIKSGLFDKIGYDYHFIRVHDALHWLRNSAFVSEIRRNYAKQSSQKTKPK